MLRQVNRLTLRRGFRMTIGLIEGYGGNKVCRQICVQRIISDWLKNQKKECRPYLPGTLTKSTMLYMLRSTGKVIAEPVVIYEGEVSPEYNAALSDTDVLNALTDLAEKLTGKLKQSRIYLAYRDKLSILER